MVCGADSIFCVIIKWLFEHEFIAKEVVERLHPYLTDAHPFVFWLYEKLRENFSTLVALASFSFGAWKWWTYREAILYKRLEQYINESDLRLPPSYQEVVRIIARPDRRTNLRQPAFAIELHGVLERNNWPLASIFGRQASAINPELQKIKNGIDKRITTAETALSSLRQQRAAADTISGAIAAACAAKARDPKTARYYDDEALLRYQSALAMPGHHRDVIAAEGKAFHLLRTGQLDYGLVAFQDLERFATDIIDDQQKAITISRSKRYQAIILQAQAPGGAQRAFGLLNPTIDGTALKLREPFVPLLRDWDLIEQGDLHYVTAYVAKRLNFPVVEPAQIELSIANYQRVLDSLPKRPLLISSKRRLQTAARAGLERVENVSRRANYDLKWLFQPEPTTSNNLQQPTKTVG